MTPFIPFIPSLLVPGGVVLYGLALMALRFEGMDELSTLLRRFIQNITK